MVWSDPNPLRTYIVQPVTCGVCGEPCGADMCAECAEMLATMQEMDR